MEIAVSCLDEGLVLLDGSRVEQIDCFPTTGIACSGSRIARARFAGGVVAEVEVA